MVHSPESESAGCDNWFWLNCYCRTQMFSLLKRLVTTHGVSSVKFFNLKNGHVRNSNDLLTSFVNPRSYKPRNFFDTLISLNDLIDKIS